MTHDHNSDTAGQTATDQQTDGFNRDQQTGQQSGEQGGQPSDQQTGQQTPPPATQTPTDPTAGETDAGFVGSDGDQSSDYLTKGENQAFAPEGQGASDTNAGTSDIETGQPTSADATLDDGADTSR